jgi:hypothetical protein
MEGVQVPIELRHVVDKPLRRRHVAEVPLLLRFAEGAREPWDDDLGRNEVAERLGVIAPLPDVLGPKLPRKRVDLPE